MRALAALPPAPLTPEVDHHPHRAASHIGLARRQDARHHCERDLLQFVRRPHHRLRRAGAHRPLAFAADRHRHPHRERLHRPGVGRVRLRLGGRTLGPAPRPPLDHSPVLDPKPRFGCRVGARFALRAAPRRGYDWAASCRLPSPTSTSSRRRKGAAGSCSSIKASFPSASSPSRSSPHGWCRISAGNGCSSSAPFRGSSSSPCAASCRNRRAGSRTSRQDRRTAARSKRSRTKSPTAGSGSCRRRAPQCRVSPRAAASWRDLFGGIYLGRTMSLWLFS